jgi:hypothetical protein
MDTWVKPAYDAECVAASCKNFSIQISNSQALSSSRRRASLAFSRSPLFEGRWSADRRAVVVTKAPFGRSIAAFLSLGPCFRHKLRAGFRPPLACPVQPLKAEPRSGPGRLPKASRVRACEARPRAPHPTGLGYPAPIKLSLCPTSVTPLEAPLIGQDPRRISELPGTGIRNAKKFFASIYRFVGRISGPDRDS